MDLLTSLIQSQALRIPPAGEVFWYTSGTVGPYYINTHYLYGGPECAEDLLAFIDAESRSTGFHEQLRQRVAERVAGDESYAAVLDDLVAAIVAREADAPVDWISGGERRDWFFSIGVAAAMGRPHLYLYKNGDAVLADGDGVAPVSDLSGRRTAHVADLVTEASSYERAWIPAIRDRGGDMAISANVIDRAQGGMQVIADAGVDALGLLRVDETLFAELRARGLVDEKQHAVLVDYFRDPTEAMRRFLVDNPAFLEEALASEDAKTAGRAKLLVEQDPYGLRGG